MGFVTPAVREFAANSLTAGFANLSHKIVSVRSPHTLYSGLGFANLAVRGFAANFLTAGFTNPNPAKWEKCIHESKL